MAVLLLPSSSGCGCYSGCYYYCYGVVYRMAARRQWIPYGRAVSTMRGVASGREDVAVESTAAGHWYMTVLARSMAEGSWPAV